MEILYVLNAQLITSRGIHDLGFKNIRICHFSFEVSGNRGAFLLLLHRILVWTTCKKLSTLAFRDQLWSVNSNHYFLKRRQLRAKKYWPLKSSWNPVTFFQFVRVYCPCMIYEKRVFQTTRIESQDWPSLIYPEILPPCSSLKIGFLRLWRHIFQPAGNRMRSDWRTVPDFSSG